MGIITRTWVKVLKLFIASIFINVTVTSSSMENTLETGCNILAFRYDENEMQFNRYDIVVFQYPIDETQIYIKRIIGLPGEFVEIINGKIYINHSEEPLQEKYLPEKWETDNDQYIFNVPEDAFLVLGDNRNHSIDARRWDRLALETGIADNQEEAKKYVYVKKDKIIAKAFIKYIPQVELLFWNVQ